MYVQQAVDYSNGMFSGMVEDGKNGTEVASTVVGFMCASLGCNKREMLNLWPVATCSYEQLAKRLIENIKEAQSYGLIARVITADGNKLNQALYRFLTTAERGGSPGKWFPNPDYPTKRIYVIHDPVHLFKNCRNNLMNAHEQTLMFPCYDEVINDVAESKIFEASWKHIRTLYNSQTNSLLRTSHRLSVKSVFPSSFDRQRLKLVTDVFCESTIAAFRLNPHTGGTCFYLELVLKWFDILNVSSLGRDQRFRKHNFAPFTRDGYKTDDRFKWLTVDMVKWLHVFMKDPRIQIISHTIATKTEIAENL